MRNRENYDPREDGIADSGNPSELLRVANLRKSFPGVVAVDDVSFSLGRGEILALIGENGAGKSTLSQVLGGALRPDSGRILLEGREVFFGSPLEAIHAGIRMMFQELSLVGSLSIAAVGAHSLAFG